jgi:hypothetical protein
MIAVMDQGLAGGGPAGVQGLLLGIEYEVRPG